MCDDYMNSPDEVPVDSSIMTVQIEDKLDKILTYLRAGGSRINAEIMSQGKVIKKPEEQTFNKINVGHQQVFTVAVKSTIVCEERRFLRFKKIVKTDYMFMGTSYYDGIIFIPKINI